MSFAVVCCVEHQPERAAEVLTNGDALVFVPLVKRSEQAPPEGPWGPIEPFWVGHRKHGTHAVASFIDGRWFRTLCGKRYGMYTFDDECGDRCKGCTAVLAPILETRRRAWQRGGSGRMEIIGPNARTFPVIEPLGKLYLEFAPGF